MQTRIANAPAPGAPRWRLAMLLAAAWASSALADAPDASPAGASAAPAYRIVPLAANGFAAGINNNGQVAFTEYIGSIPRARFYDGTIVRDLGTFGGPDAFVNALNERGQVVGGASTATPGVFHAFRWSSSTGLVDLNRPGVGYSVASDINNLGQVVGAARFVATSPIFHGFRWSARAGMRDLGAFGPTSESAAYAINDGGTATGWSDEAAGPRLTLAVRWPPGFGPFALNRYPSIASIGYDINKAGQIVGGAAFDARLNDQAFIWTRAGGLRGLGTEPSYLSWADEINERGLVIGQLYSSPVDRSGFIWRRDSGLLKVGTPGVDTSDTADVNNRGQVVGNLNERGYLWTRSDGFVDLTSRLVGAPPELSVYAGLAINDRGTIVAATNAGTLVLLVPESASFQAPVSGPIKYTGTARADALLSFSAAFSDVDVRDTHKAVWSWGDGSKTAGIVSESKGTGSVSGQHAYRAAGIYTVRLHLTDSSGKSSTAERKLIVCATGATIAGEGAFISPSVRGAATTALRRPSVGRFAFFSEDAGARKAAVEVDVAGMALRSSQVESVTNDGTRVQYSGRGTVNGAGNYRFTLTATSGARMGAGGKDRIHVRIAHLDPGTQREVVDYDNGARAQARGDAQQAATAAAGAEGSVVLGEGRLALGAQ